MDVLQNFEILSFLGQGTFSVVKLGQDKKTKEKVAIKILEKKKILRKDDEIRVKREIEILKKSNHINVIRAKKILEDSQNFYIIMEYCEKGELFEHIVDEVCLDEKEASYYFYQLINGLESLHKNGIVHRDLKPENLLINKNNILKIIDFGLSNYYENNKLLSTPCGSPCYAAPEMLCGKNYDGISVDIWTTGIILYALLCGCLPFDNEDRNILYKKIMKGKISYPENLEKDAIDLIKKILVINPKERISIKNIKKHPFYQKGRREFIKMHPSLIIIRMKKYGNEKDDKDKNMKIIKNKDIYGLREGLKVNEEKNENINLQKSIKNDNIRKNVKPMISNLQKKNNEEQKIDNKTISNNMKNINRKIDINKKQNYQKEVIKKAKPMHFYNYITEKGSKKNINSFFSKYAKTTFNSNQNKSNTKIITEYNTLDNKNKINNQNFLNSRNFKQLIRNNNYNVNNEIINSEPNDKNNVSIQKHRNKLNQIFNELKHMSISIQPEKYKFFIEYMKGKPYNINIRNFEGNQINKFLTQIENKNEELKGSNIIKLTGNKKKKGKINKATSEKKRNKKFTKNINIIDSNMNYNERNNNTENFTFNDYNMDKSKRKIKTEIINNEFDLNTYMAQKHTKKINNDSQMINNQYNTIIYSNIINNMFPAYDTNIHRKYKSKKKQNINTNFNIKNKSKNNIIIKNLKNKLHNNNYKENHRNINMDKTISNNIHNKIISFTETSNYLPRNNNDIIYKRFFDTDIKSPELNINEDYINDSNDIVIKGLELNNVKKRIYSTGEFNQRNDYTYNINHFKTQKVNDNYKDNIMKVNHMNNLYQKKIQKIINDGKINKNNINHNNKNDGNNNIDLTINSKNIYNNYLTIYTKNLKISKNRKRVQKNSNPNLDQNFNPHKEITDQNNKAYKTLEAGNQDKHTFIRNQNQIDLNDNMNKSSNNYGINNNLLDLNNNNFKIKDKLGVKPIKNHTKNISNLLDN